MATLTRYSEWMSRGRRTNREAYVLEDAEWQLDKTFNLADELLRDPEIKTVFKVALEKGAEIICRPAEVTASLCFPVVALHLLTRNFSSPGRSLDRTCLIHSIN